MVVFFNHVKLDRASRTASSTQLGHGASRTNDDPDPNISPSGKQPAKNDKEEPNSILYKDDHLIIHAKSPKPLKPKTLCAFRRNELRYHGQPFTNPMFGQYLFATLVYMSQLYLMYMYMMDFRARNTIPLGTAKRILAAVDLAIPTGTAVFSIVIFISDVAALEYDYTDAAKVARTLVLPVMLTVVYAGIFGLLYGFVTSV